MEILGKVEGKKNSLLSKGDLKLYHKLEFNTEIIISIRKLKDNLKECLLLIELGYLGREFF
jgi:hypothetical protein